MKSWPWYNCFPSFALTVKEEETDDILEDVYAESDRRQDGDQTDFQSPEENYQACQESQEDEKFAVIADIESFPEQSSNKDDDDGGGEYQESQRNYVKQSDILNYQHTSGKVGKCPPSYTSVIVVSLCRARLIYTCYTNVLML